MKVVLNILTGLFIIASLVLFISGCEKAESYSEVPYIEFKSYRVFDTIVPGFPQNKVAAITFSFVDGDGDIGYRSDIADTTKRDNLYFSRYEQRNGKLINVDSLLKDSIKFSIPYDDVMNREGQNKTLKGSIKINLDELIINYDTIKYDFYIIDRAGNKSNIAQTPEIVGLKE